MKHLNVVLIIGKINGTPEKRELANGSTVTEFNVTVAEENKARATVPISYDGPMALGDGDEVMIAGQVRRRFYRAGGSTVSRTDIRAVNVMMVGTQDLPKALRLATSGLWNKDA